jgi:MoaA/NifB/PqqE/SkfB family radical SAM enzyme
MRLLVLELSDRCDQRCSHCQIWSGTGRGAALSLAERLQVVDGALAAGAREALLTGGEPLLSPDLWPVAARLRAGGARLMLATTGMQLERHAADVAGLFHEVYVSLDGGRPVTHDAARGVASFARLAAGIAALWRLDSRPLLVARSTVHTGNADEMAETVALARTLGVDHVSFLPLDARSAAFGGTPEARRALLPTDEQRARLERAVADMDAAGTLADGFVLESAAKLLGLVRHLSASAGRGRHERPRCDAPRWSSVVTVDGRLQPCFFHEAVGDARLGVAAVRRSAEYRTALARIEADNETCASCVCPKWRGSPWREVWR